MFGNKSKLRKIKSVHDVLDAYDELCVQLESFDHESYDYDTTKALLTAGLITIQDFVKKYNDVQEYSLQRELNTLKFRHEMISYTEYQSNMIEIDRNEAIFNNKQKPIGVDVNRDEWSVDPYVQENIDYQYTKAKLDLSFRTGDVEFYDYQLKLADLNNEAYAKVVFEPDYENNSKTLNVDARFNDIFIDDLHSRSEFTPNFNDDGSLNRDDLVEQWFSTAIIVMAANMLRETDLDIFRSVSNDNPGVPIIETLQFDDETLDQLGEIERQQLEEIEKHGRFYR